MRQSVVVRLPPALIRALRRAQLRSPLVAKAVRVASGNGKMRHGAGAGLTFDWSGDYPGYLLGTSELDEQTFVQKNLSRGDPGYVASSIDGGPLPPGGHWDAVLTPAEAVAQTVWAREREFHDALARELDVDALAEQHAPDGLDRALLDLAGDVRGRRILDAGCGQGDLTLHLLQQGAKVTALDVSPGMIDLVRRRAQRLPDQGGELRTVAAPLEESNLPNAGFDLVLGKFILHHIDVESGAHELRRVLRPGGRAIFIENAGDNALLTFARNRLAGRWGIPRLGTEDEHPLMARDINSMRSVFGRATAHYPVFECLVLFDRQVLRFKYPRASRVIRGADNAIHRFVPPLRRFSYRVIVELGVASDPGRQSETP